MSKYYFVGSGIAALAGASFLQQTTQTWEGLTVYANRVGISLLLKRCRMLTLTRGIPREIV